MLISCFPQGGGSGGGGGIPLGPVTALSGVASSGKVHLKWEDPADLVLNGVTIATWGGTKLLRKAGSYPANHRDGTVLLDSKVRDAYKSAYFTDSGLSNGTAYYYKFFPYSKDGAFTDSPSDELTLTPAALPPKNLPAKSVTAVSSGKIYLNWTDPEDSVTDGIITSAWAGTKLVYKAGSYPATPTDGTLALNSTTQNAHSVTPLELGGLTNGTAYYIAFFPYATDGAVNTDTANRLTATPVLVPLGNVSGMSAVKDITSITLKWNDPNDTVSNGVTTARFAGTKLVYKQGSTYPTSPADGILAVDNTTRNLYASAGFAVTGLTGDTTYSFQWFPYTAEGSVTNNAANRMQVRTDAAFTSVSFSADSWETIALACTLGKYKQVYSIGDTKPVTLTTGEVITVRIEDFDHDDLTSGGKAPMSLMFKDCLKETRRMNATDTNVGGWGSSEMRTWISGTLLGQLPADLSNLIKPVNKLTSAGNASPSLTTTSDKLWLPSYTEVNFQPHPSYSPGGEGSAYPLFISNASRIKLGNGSVNYWWLRSPCASNTANFDFVNSNGSCNNGNASGACAVAAGFCI